MAMQAFTETDMRQRLGFEMSLNNAQPEPITIYQAKLNIRMKKAKMINKSEVPAYATVSYTHLTLPTKA